MPRSWISRLIGTALAVVLASLTPVGPAAASTREYSDLPFTFVVNDVSFGMQSQRFATNRGAVCIDIAVKTVSNPGAAFGDFMIRLYEDAPRNDRIIDFFPVPTDGVTRTFCFDELSADEDYYFFPGFGFVGGSGSVWESVDGIATVRVPAL